MAKFNEIEKLLKEKGIDFKVINFPTVAVSVEDVMRLAGDQIKREEITKTLVVKLKCGDFVVCLLKGDDRLNKNVLISDGQHQDQSISRLATKEEVLEVAGVEIGAVCPILLNIPIIFDEKVMSLKRINLGSGDLLKGLEMNFADLISLLSNYTTSKIREDNKGKRILTGDTPTGKLHLGHFVGTLENRVKLQNEYETFIILADTHALNTLNVDYQVISENTRQVLLDELSVGLDPDKVTFFIESGVPEIYELAAIFSMYVSHNRALRNPTIKDEIKMKGMGDQFSLGFINYPIYQAADILCVKGELVPVGKDQEAHLEQAREIARTFNMMQSGIFPEPKALVGRVGRLVGTDGSAKMSKTLGNVIYLSDSTVEVEKKVMSMYTDPNRIHADDPGKVEGNPVFVYLDAFGSDADKPQTTNYKLLYTKGQVGDIEVKKYLVKILNNFLDPIRKRRAEYEKQPELVEKILQEGTVKARIEAQKTLLEVKKAMKMDYFDVNQSVSANTNTSVPISENEIISIDEFMRTKLKVGTVLTAAEVENSDKLLKLEIDLGEEKPRQILAGIKEYYSPRDFVGNQVVVVSNLEPRVMRGLESQGMMLAADSKDGPIFLTVAKEVSPGTKIR